MIYLASPYTDPNPTVIQRRAREVIRHAGYFIEQGFHIYSPIAHNHEVNQQYFNGRVVHFDNWREYDLHMVERSDEFWLLQLDGWEESYGCTSELEFARNCDKPVNFVTPIQSLLTDLSR